ncbi:orotate phosphoribosyltransferase [Bacteroidia bacterium]|nr:orotate phosphoribosyltransferase [Bacteroidia bacterium]
MEDIKRQIAQSLLQIKAIKLNPANYFTWASGWRSPIYCDNRRILSHPAIRRQVCEAFAGVVARRYPDVEVLAGVATGAIAHGALVAEAMGLPFIYVRSSPKSHGLANQVEGEVAPGARVVVIEDLISTGGSSLGAVEVLREAGCRVQGMAAIFTYGFAQAVENFARAGVALDTLCDYQTMIALAAEQGYVQPSELDTLRRWREDPAGWMQDK